MTDDVELGRREFVAALVGATGGCYAYQGDRREPVAFGGGDDRPTVREATNPLFIASGDVVDLYNEIVGPYDGIVWEQSGTLKLSDGAGIRLNTI